MKVVRPLEFLFKCHECGVEHRVPLDKDGHWHGNCSAPECEAPMSVTILEDAWQEQRDLHAAMGAVWPYSEGTVH